MIERAALAGLFCSVLAIAAAYGSAFIGGAPAGWAAWSMALGTPGALVSVMVLGAVRDGALGRLAWPFAAVFVMLAGSFAAALVLTSGQDAAASTTLWLGLPRGAAVILYGTGLLPLLVVPLAYAVTFDELALSREDWERVRAAAAGSTPAPPEDRPPEGGAAVSRAAEPVAPGAGSVPRSEADTR